MSLEAKLASTIAPNPAPNPAPEPEPEQAEDEAPEQDESNPAQLFADDDEDEAPEGDEPEQDESEDGLTIDPEATYMVDGEKVLGKDLVGSKFRQADYTKKTQAIAEERKQFKAQLEEKDDELDEVVSWAKSLSNPDRMEYELETNFPEAYAALRDRIIEQALEESELKDDRARQYYQAARKARLEEIGRKAEQEFAQAKEAKVSQRKQVAEIRENVNKWMVSGMKVSGLDEANPDHRTALIDRLAVGYKGVVWTEEVVAQAAKSVAKLLGVKVKPEAPAEDPAKAKLPVVRPVGHKPPAKQVQVLREQKAKASKPQSFDELRKKYNAV